MTDGLSRREMVALTGVGLLGAACTSSDKGLAEGAVRREGGAKVASMPLPGPNEPWGLDAHNCAPTGCAPFAPSYIALLYLGLEPNWKVRVNHASYPLVTGAAGRLAKAKAVFKSLIAAPGKRFKDSPHHEPYRRQVTQIGEVDSESFDNFKFRNPTELFIYIHHPAIKLIPRQLIFFTSLRANGWPAERNYSFFNAEAVDPIDLGSTLNSSGKMIRLENHATDDEGMPIKAKDLIYSMNIHFQVPQSTGDYIPIIIDPDTGNGMGNEP